MTSRGPAVSTRGVVLLLSGVALVVVLAFRSAFLAMDLHTISGWATGLSILTLIGVAAAARTRLWSAGLWYLLMLAVFHLGLAWLLAFNTPVSDRYAAYIDTWFRDNNATVEAVYLSILAMVAFLPAYALTARPREDSTHPATVPGFGRAGFLLLGAGAVVSIGYIVLRAPQLLHGGTYDEFVNTVGGSTPIALGMLLVGIGAVLTAAAPKSRTRKRALWIFLLYTAVMLSFGARTAAMYAVVAFIVAAVRVHRMPRPKVAIAVLVAGIVGIGVLQQVRDHGLSVHSLTNVSISPVPTLSETGGTLRAVSLTIDLHDVHGESFRHGQTYLVGLLRAEERVRGVPRPDPDPRFAGSEVAQVAADQGFAIGYSVVAEAWLNFGTPGVVGFFLLLGLLLGWLDAGPLRDPVLAARLGVLMYALAYEVRQSSNILLTDVIIGLLIVEVVWRHSRARRVKQDAIDRELAAIAAPR